MKQRKFYELAFFSSLSWHTLNAFTALKHLYHFVETLTLLVYAFTQNMYQNIFFDYSLTFFPRTLK